ncbi:YbgF trimerization domain-containing protein [Porticoccaceae bacterium nBUS_09]
MIKFRKGLCILALSIPVIAVSQDLTPVVDAKASAFPVDDAIDRPVMSAAAKRASDRFDIMQNLREEVRMLRGMVEELSYELQQVKQRQLDDYLDIDRRLGILNGGLPADNVVPDSSLEQSLNSPSVEQSSSAEIQESSDFVVADTLKLDDYEVAVKQDYEAASNKLLKDRDIEAATVSLNAHLEKFPNSPFTANAHYWLGEIYLLQGETELARQAFTTITEEHKNHPKVMDSRFKLGKIYFQLGEIGRAKSLLEAAAESSGGVASKARSFLDMNFQ